MCCPAQDTTPHETQVFEVRSSDIALANEMTTSEQDLEKHGQTRNQKQEGWPT